MYLEEAQHLQGRLINFKKLGIVCGVLLVGVVVLIVWHLGHNGLTGVGSSSKLNLLREGWGFMPGVTSKPDGLHVSYLGRAIVKQDGSPGQMNPPVNLYGTHLATSNDYTLTATLADLRGSATFKLYTDAPVVQDEFRIEPKSIDFTIKNSTLTISSWPGYAAQGVYDQSSSQLRTLPVSSGDVRLVLSDKNGSTTIAVNGETIVQLSPAESLNAGAVWFGLSAESQANSWTLKKLEASAPDSRNITLINTQNTTVYHASEAQLLQTLASQRRPGFLIGAAMALSPAVADAQYGRAAFGGNFGVMTTENVLKWQFIHPQPNTYDFKEADALVAIAQKNRLKVHGHTLIFGEANPTWVQQVPTSTADEKTAVRRTMVDHIQRTVEHFKGRISSWDVVNEPLADEDTDSVGLRQHVWFKAMGEAYIAEAFRAAHRADPSAKLFINDFGLESDGGRWSAMYELVKKLKADGVPIDGVGFEAHVYQPGDEIDPTVLRSHIAALASLGLVARVSEMDVYNDGDDAAQAKQYSDILAACLAEPSCVSWTTWGVADRYDLSLNDADQVESGQDFLWNESVSPTSALIGLRQTLGAPQ